MRAVILTGDDAERDLLLAAFEPLHPARLPPYAGTRVVRTGIGTLVVIPAGRTAAESAVAAGIAANRLRPDVLLALGRNAGPDVVVADRVRAAEGTYDVPPRLPEAAAVGLTGAGVPFTVGPVGEELPAAWGVAVAGRVHGVSAGAVLLPAATGTADDDAQRVAAVARALFGHEWWFAPSGPTG
jgi:hypothetical protein